MARGTLSEVSEMVQVSLWWVEAIVIEYLECREYAGPTEIWKFDFERLSRDEILAAVRTHRLVVNGTIFHNVHESTWRSRVVGRLVSDVPVALSKDQEDSVPEGRVSSYHFCFSGNPIEVWDPKLSFSSHFQVMDGGKIWQWKVADFKTVEGRHYGKWVSDEIDLEALDEIPLKLAALRNKPLRPGESGYEEFSERVRNFYSWLEAVRSPIRQKLFELHLKKVLSQSKLNKTVENVPPILSQFEDFTVEEGEILTRFHAEPVFFRAMVSHCKKAKDLFGSGNSALDEIYQERLQAVVNAAACLESFVNGIGAERVESWKSFESLQPEAKWHLCLLVHGKGKLFDRGKEPYQTLGKVVDLRNRWLHYKKPFAPVRVTHQSTITWIEAQMGQSFVDSLPERVRQLIEEICTAINFQVPPWLKSGPGWELSL